MNRRQFLSGSIASFAVGAHQSLTQSAPPASMSLGFSLYGMKSLSLVDALRECATIGYDAVELPVMPGWPGEAKSLGPNKRKAIREAINQSALSLPSLMENLPLDGDDPSHRAGLDRLATAFELGRDLVPGAPPLVESILGGKPGQWDALKTRFRDRLGDWAQTGAKAKAMTVFKPHRMGAVNLPEHALWLIEQVKSPWLKLGYDYSHFALRGLPLADTMRSLIPRTAFIHVKDVRIVDGQTQFLLPGEGGIDYVELLKGVAAAGYTGCVCVEVSGMIHSKKDYDPVKTARTCYDRVAAAFAKAGVQRRSRV